MPLLANDMHLELGAPAIWFENHLSWGNIDVNGITIPGTFLLTAGHNRHVAWGFTDRVNDVQDLYEEHLRRTPKGKLEYEFQGEWLPAEVRREEIRVRGKPPVVEEVILTRHGPVINLLVEKDFPGTPPLALRWTALEPETTMQALHDMAYACDCTELHKALALFSGPGQNTVYADTRGNIGFTLSGRTPIRAKGSGSVPVPGWTGEFEWIGYIPHGEMPHLENPAKDYVATATSYVNLTDLEARSMGGPPFRFIADLGDHTNGVGEITAWGMLTPGQSGHPTSPHYRNGIRPWFEGSYHPMLMNKGEVEKNLSSRLDLQPG
jgi:penicillin amidase